ncbi:UbiD family decarboxylase [Chloroflexota bacterium]
MSYKDLRDFLRVVDAHGELKRLNGVDWNLEMGSIAELVYHQGKAPQPVLLFDEIPGYPKEYSCLFGLLSSLRRIAIALGLPDDQIERKAILQNWRKKSKISALVPAKFVTSVPVDTHVVTGDKVDLMKFPSPKFHELDGGRYLGTGHAVIQKDPDTGYVNLGVYRVMLVDRNRLAIHILEGQQGSLIMNEKYFNQGKAMPIAIAIGIDPALWFAAAKRVPWQTSEYDYAGMIKGEPIEVFTGPYTGLPLPANAEIVIEGECRPGDLIDEGPFAESCGYYANLGLEPVPEPVIQVSAIHYRDNPILTCAIPSVPPSDYTLLSAFTYSATLWDMLESAGILGIKDVWCPEVGHGNMLQVVSIEQKYAGHSTEVGVIASQFRLGGLCKYTVVVDDDIDPSDMNQVIWAIETRTDPARSIQIIEHCHSTSRDTAISPEEKRKYKVAPKPLYASKCIIDACQPFEWKNEWYPVAISSPELRNKILDKYGEVIKELL